MNIVVKGDPRRIDDVQATLELNGLQFFHGPWLRRNGTHRRCDAPSEGQILPTIDQAAFAVRSRSQQRRR